MKTNKVNLRKYHHSMNNGGVTLSVDASVHSDGEYAGSQLGFKISSGGDSTSSFVVHNIDSEMLLALAAELNDAAKNLDNLKKKSLAKKG